MAKKKSRDNSLPVITHILGLLTGIIGPLIILLVADHKRDKNHAKKALNWQISIIIYSIGLFFLLFLSLILSTILVGFILLIPTILALITIGILDLVFSIMAAVKASKNELWDYPLSIPFLK